MFLAPGPLSRVHNSPEGWVQGKKSKPKKQIAGSVLAVPGNIRRHDDKLAYSYLECGLAENLESRLRE